MAAAIASCATPVLANREGGDNDWIDATLRVPVGDEEVTVRIARKGDQLHRLEVLSAKAVARVPRAEFMDLRKVQIKSIQVHWGLDRSQKRQTLVTLAYGEPITSGESPEYPSVMFTFMAGQYIERATIRRKSGGGWDLRSKPIGGAEFVPALGVGSR